MLSVQYIILYFFFFYSYYLQFEARKFMSQKGDVAIDDIAMSPKCFGLGNYKLYNNIFI